jgi:cell fate regulator YaaT (PSP1 superfamily)
MERENPPLKAVVRYGCLTCRTECTATKAADAKPGDAVVARTERGVEYALILTAPEPVPEGAGTPFVEVLRKATEEDDRRQAQIDREGHSAEFRFCRARIEERGLPMRLVRAEKILGGQRMTFYFMAEGRVDFRDLVRDLAHEFKMRIELKQIGARDEAKVLGDISYCGRELCCSSWIREMRPINMKMAKNQKSTLDPSKISGVCGRLLCCLRYEDEVYTDLRRQLPRRGARVRIQPTGATGMVLHQEVLAGKCVVLLDRGGTATVPGAELEVLTGGTGPED